MKSIGSDIKPVTEPQVETPQFIIDLRSKDTAGSPLPHVSAPAWEEPAPIAKAKASHSAYRRNPAARREAVFMEAIPAPVPMRRAVPSAPAAIPVAEKTGSAARVTKIILLAAAAFILLSLNIALPDRAIAIHFVLSLLYRIESQRTFLVALIFLVFVAIWSAIGNTVTAQDYAVYAFYFLLIGLVAALRETVWPKIPAPNRKP